MTNAGVDFGSAYELQVFSEALPLPPGVNAGDAFGSKMEAAGDTLFVSAPSADNAAGKATGAVFVYKRVQEQWQYAARLAPTDGQAGDSFGGDLSLSDGTLAVMSVGNDGAGGDWGAVYIFDRQADGTWAQSAKVVPTDSGSLFRGNVSLSGNSFIAGGRTETTDIQVFQRGAVGAAWARVATLAGVPYSGWGFGSDVALSGDSALVGIPWKWQFTQRMYAGGVYA
jgi:hypothetical protein